MSISDDLRILSQHAEGAELIYPDEAPGIGNAALSEIRGHICDIGTALHQAHGARPIALSESLAFLSDGCIL